MAEVFILTISFVSFYSICSFSYTLYDMRKQQVDINLQSKTECLQSPTTLQNENDITNYTHYNDECPICLDNINEKDMYVLKCNHAYHRECIDIWVNFSHKNECPLCNQ